MSLDKLHVRRFIDISTGHITSADDDRLRAITTNGTQGTRLDECGIAVESKDQGYIVWDRSPCLDLGLSDHLVSVVGEAEPYGTGDEYDHQAILLESGFSLAFVNLLELAAICDAGLWLDADAPEYEELPRFDWGEEKNEGHPVRIMEGKK